MKPQTIEMPALQFWLESAKAKEIIFLVGLPFIIWFSWELSNSIFIKESTYSVLIRPLTIFLPIPLFSGLLLATQKLLLRLWSQSRVIAIIDNEHIKFFLEQQAKFSLQEITSISYRTNSVAVNILQPMNKNLIIINTTHGTEIIKTSITYEPLKNLIEAVNNQMESTN